MTGINKAKVPILENSNIDNQYENTTIINEKFQLLTEKMLKASNEASFSIKIHKIPYGKFFFLLDQKIELSNYNKDEIKL